MVAAMHAHGSSAHAGAEVGALVAGRVRARTRWRALCARAARFPVGRRQGRGPGQACARTAGVGRGELGANVGMAHFWRSWMRGWSQSERSRSASADFALCRAIRVSSLGSGPSSVRYRVSKRGQLWVLL
jgi:hypothetical protein